MKLASAIIIITPLTHNQISVRVGVISMTVENPIDSRTATILTETKNFYEIELQRVRGLDDKLLAVIGISGVTLTILLDKVQGVLKLTPSIGIGSCQITAYRIGIVLLLLSGLIPFMFLISRYSMARPSDSRALLDGTSIDVQSIYASVYPAMWKSARAAGNWKARGLAISLLIYIVSLVLLGFLILS